MLTECLAVSWSGRCLLFLSYISNKTWSLTTMTRNQPLGGLQVCSALSRQGWRVTGWAVSDCGDRRGVGVGGAVHWRWAETWGRGTWEAEGWSFFFSSASLYLHLHQCPEGGGRIRRQWKNRVCYAWVQQRRWGSAAGSKAAPGPERKEKRCLTFHAVWNIKKSQCVTILIILKGLESLKHFHFSRFYWTVCLDKDLFVQSGEFIF